MVKLAPINLRFAVVAVDVVTVAFFEGQLQVLVSKVNRPPHYINTFGFLGGIIKSKETTEEASVRILKEKGRVTPKYIEQLFTFSAVERDKRNRVVSVAYLCIINPEIAAIYHDDEASFMPIAHLPSLAYDHDEMLLAALTRLRGKLEYTTIAQFLLPRFFTLTDLQTVYEVVLGQVLDKRNFRKKILALGILKETGKMQEGVANRPAALYEFKLKKVSQLALLV